MLGYNKYSFSGTKNEHNMETTNTTATTASSGQPGGVVRHAVASRGVATSFGFKPRQRPTTAIPVYHDNRNPTSETPTSFDIDTNGNASTKMPSNRVSSATETNMNRFSNTTRQNSASRIVRSANPKPSEIIAGYNNVEFRNNNSSGGRSGGRSLRAQPRSMSCADQNRNKPTPGVVGRYKLQTTNFPKPQIPTTVRMDSKNVKHATNTNRKYHQDRGESSADSGMGSENTTTDIEVLDTSPKNQRTRHLELFMTKGSKKFDVRDLTDDGTVIESSLITLPKLPSVFQTSTTEISPTSQQTSPLASYQPPPRSFSLVRERTLEYQRNLLQQQPVNPPITTPLRASSRTMSTSLDSTEEKVTRDRHHAEKDIAALRTSQCGGESMIELHSKRMISSIKSTPSTFQNLLSTSTPSSTSTAASLKTRDITLTIEDSKFAAVAAASSNLLEDETSPVDSLVSSCTDSEELALGKPKPEEEEKDSKEIDEKASPETPTNVSLSLSDSKDYFDDEIADQPTLHVFENEIPISETTITLVDNTHNSPQLKKKPREDAVSASPLTHRKLLERLPQLRRSGSLNTLSPCESIASDDLMMDFELSHGSGVEGSNDRLDSKNTSGMPSLDDPEILAGGDDSDIMRELQEELTALVNKSAENSSSRNSRFATISPRVQTPSASGGGIKNGVSNGSDVMVDGASSPLLQQTHASRSRLTTSSTSTPIAANHQPLSHSPLRLTRRYAQTSTSSSPIPVRLANIGVAGGGGGGDRGGYDSDDSLCIDRAMHGSMMQDIVGMKTMLLKLKRVLQEPDNALMRSETLNPFDSPLKVPNGNCHCGSDKVETVVGIGGTSDRFELADLRRQVVFLQEQLEERERIVQHLRQQVADHTLSNSAPTSICTTVSNGNSMEMCNAATQTERVRPMSAGPSLLQNFPTVVPGTSSDSRGTNGPLVSVNEPETIIAPQKRKILRRPPSLVEFRPNHKFKL